MKALVTGASGFVGEVLCRELRARGHRVRAGVRTRASGFGDAAILSLADPASLRAALEGVDTLFHFAALTDPTASLSDLRRVNVDGTRALWQAAADARIERALYCSTSAVYGLLSKKPEPLTEEALARAVESYGRSKLEGERAAMEIAARRGLATVVIRPAAVFGPGDRTRLGAELRRAAVAQIALSGLPDDARLSFVHVDDVASAAIHLVSAPGCAGEIFNVAVEPPATFDDAARAYSRALKRSRRPLIRHRAMAFVSSCARRLPRVGAALRAVGGTRLVYEVGRAGFDLTISSKKLRDSGFTFARRDLDDVLASCLG